MWRPEQRLRHALPIARWPSRDEAERSRLFSPIEVGRLRMRHRTWVPAMVPWRATEDGVVTEDVLDWYERFARGRPGALVVEATGIRDIPSGPLLRIGHDRFLPGLSELVSRVRRASGGETRLFIQIIDFLTIRRRPEPGQFLRRFLQITDRHRERLGLESASESHVREQLCTLSHDELERVLEPRELEALDFGYRERVTDLHLPQIRDLPRVLPDLFASAARRAEAAGFDGVELHYAHAYTMASFLSATNQRNDGYGTTLAGRLRLPLEVYEAVRARVGSSFVIGARYLADECIEGGNGLAEATEIGVALARAGMDFLSLSRGGKFDDAEQPAIGWAAYPYTGRSGWECMPTTLADANGPFGRNAAAVGEIRRAVRAAGHAAPIVVSGAIATFDQAESILERGGADIIAMARQSLADPDFSTKVLLGRGDEVRRCVYTNYCEGLDQKHKQVTCKLWDRVELDEPGVKRDASGRRRLVAPGWSPDR